MEKDKAGLLKYVGFIALMAIIDPCAFVFVFAAYDNIGASVASIIMILIAWVHIIVPGVITAIVMLKTGMTREDAQRKLSDSDGYLKRAIGAGAI